MKRREFIALVSGSVSWVFNSAAQASKKVWRVGVVTGEDGERRRRALEENLAQAGYTPNTDFTVSLSTVVPSPKNYEDAIARLLPNIDILVVWSTLGTVAARKVGVTLPTVFLSVGAPVNIGIVESLARPGGNMTGVTFEAAGETYAKRLQILKEVAPAATRVAILRGAGDANVPFAMESLEQMAPALGVTLLPVDIKLADDLEAAFMQMTRDGAQALLVIAGSLTFFGSKPIAELALKHKLPSCHAFKETVAEGGLVSLGPDLVAMNRQGANYVDKIIQGFRPADLPVEQPTRYEMHVNLKTAKALGINVPSTLLARADELIE
jgi:putative ABC transport system substrate-binding protein